MKVASLAVTLGLLLILQGAAVAQDAPVDPPTDAVAPAEPAAPPATDPVDATAVPEKKLPPTIADFMKEPLISHVALAPGGGHIAYVQRQDSISYLVVRDLRALDAGPVASRLGEVRVYGLKWVNDDRLVYSAGSNEMSVDYKRGNLVISGAPRLFASNRDLKDTFVFFKDEKRIESANSISTSDINLVPSDAEHFIIPLRVGRNLDLVRVNVRDGKWTTVAGGNDRTVEWFVDMQGKPAMRFEINRRFTEIRVMLPQFRANGNIDWKQAFAMRFDAMREQAPDFSPVAPGPQPGYYYVIGRPEGADRFGVHLYNLETQRYASEVFTHPRVDVENGIVDPRTGIFVGATFWDDTQEATFVEGRLQAHFDGLMEFFQRERSVIFLDRSADQKIWLLLTRGPRDPGTYHAYNMTEARNDVIGSAMPHLTPDRLGKAEAIAYKARDGLDLKGYLTMPPDLPEGTKPPLIVMPHGGPEVRDAMAYDVVVQYLATRGYAVFQPNFRGSSGYGKAFVAAGDRQFGGAMQTDVVDGVQLLIDQGRVDGSRMCIFGESYGGYAALMGAVRFPDLYRCAASSAGVSDLHRQVRWERDEEGSNSEAYKYWVTKIGNPDRDKAAMEAASPIHNLSAIKVPILLLHGKQDDTVPFEQSDLMHAALKKAGLRSKIIVFENTGHSMRGANLETYLTHLEQFFAEHLAAPATP